MKRKNHAVIVIRGVKNLKRKERDTGRDRKAVPNFQTTGGVIRKNGKRDDRRTSRKLPTRKNIPKGKIKRKRRENTVR